MTGVSEMIGAGEGGESGGWAGGSKWGMGRVEEVGVGGGGRKWAGLPQITLEYFFHSYIKQSAHLAPK